jgi:hypothetical protein
MKSHKAFSILFVIVLLGSQILSLFIHVVGADNTNLTPFPSSWGADNESG